MKVLYVCSAARCGSTLTDMFLGGHPKAASLGEINFLAKAIMLGEQCSCGATVRDCAHWQAVYGRLAKSGFDLQRPYRYRLWDAVAWNSVDKEHQTRLFLAGVRVRGAWMSARDLLPTSLRNAFPMPPAFNDALANKWHLYEAVSDAWGKELVVDSSKHVREAVELYRRHPQSVRILLLTRDGRGVYLSRRSTGRGRQESVRGWSTYYARALELLDRNVPPESRMQLKYEEIASNPERFGETLCHFVGLDFQPSMLKLDSVVRHMVNGNATRFRPGKGITLDERWRQDLQPAEAAFFEAHGGRMNAVLGYH